MLTNYQSEDTLCKIELKNTNNAQAVNIYATDDNHSFDKILSIKAEGSVTFLETVVKTNSIIFIEII